MVKALETLGDRLLGLLVPKTTASACECYTSPCELPDGTIFYRECCKDSEGLFCEPCD